MHLFLIIALLLQVGTGKTTDFPRLRPAPPLPPIAKGEPPHYRAILLPSHFEAFSQNNQNVVVGRLKFHTAAVWKMGKLLLLKQSHPEYRDEAVGIGEDEAVIGTATTQVPLNDPTHMILWKKNHFRWMKEPKGYDQGSPTAMNRYGDIICMMTIFSRENSISHSFLLRDSRYFLLKGLYASAINDCGQVVGTPPQTYSERVLLWQNGVVRDLGRGIPTSINNRGQIIGSQSLFQSSESADHLTVERINAYRRPFLLQKGKFIYLRFSDGVHGAIATHINNRGQIVGYGINQYLRGANYMWQTMEDALLWQNEVPYSLQARTRGLKEWILMGALTINDKGVILCRCRKKPLKNLDYQEDVRYVLLEPVKK